MGLSHRLEMRQGQALVMTPQLLQAIKLLQLSHVDLVAYVEAELERNPLLERIESDPGDAITLPERSLDTPAPATPEPWDQALSAGRTDVGAEMEASYDNVFSPDASAPPLEWTSDAGEALSVSSSLWSGVGSGGGGYDGDLPDLEARLAEDVSLRDHLVSQLDLASPDPTTRLIGRHIIDSVDEAGYFGESVEEVAERLGADPARVAGVLALVQTFEPSGVGARSLAECLAIQLREQNRFDPAMEALLSRLDLVAKRDLGALRRLCGVDEEDLADMLAEIRRLDPKPGRAFGGAPAEVLVPDVFVRAAPDGSWLVDLNPETLPRVLMNQAYYARVSRAARTENEKAFVSDCLQSASWLTRSLDQRAKTILKVASEIVRQQDGFFVYGVSHLRPLNLKTVADAIGMHESTVSRVTSNKAIGTSRGTFEMKYFFTASIPSTGGHQAHSSEAVRYRIKQLIDAEDPEDILSDDALVKRLKDEGIDIARRTVAKYRESLRIASSIDRRREKAGQGR